MTNKLNDVWTTRDFPVLVELARRFDQGASHVRATEIEQAMGWPKEDVQRAGMALKRRGLVDVQGASGIDVIFFRDLSGEAYFLTGLHPNGDELVSQLVSALRQAAEQTPDPQEKSRLRTLADNAGSISRDVLAGVLTAVVTGAVT